MSNTEKTTTKEKTQTYDVMKPLLDAMYLEFKELSKKKPDSAVSIKKIKIVNRLLEKVRTVLSDEESLEFLDLLEEEDLPQASDVTLILSQYTGAMKAFCERYYVWQGILGEHAWSIE